MITTWKTPDFYEISFSIYLFILGQGPVGSSSQSGGNGGIGGGVLDYGGCGRSLRDCHQQGPTGSSSSSDKEKVLNLKSSVLFFCRLIFFCGLV